MGEDYVRSMCHDIEDPTFDATAVATNPQRPGAAGPPSSAAAGRPARPTARGPSIIDESHPPVAPAGAASTSSLASRGSDARARPDRPRHDGRSDYSGPLVSDLDFAEFSHSALVRIADEVCLQMHLLYLASARAVCARRRRAAGARDLL